MRGAVDMGGIVPWRASAGQRIPVGMLAKRARGQMARFIIDGRLTTPDALLDFQRDGYRYHPDLSKPAQPVFVK
ncbi:MAG: peroxide stress protein YaaA [Magnetococcales bacterium]|nr:peroxide stress protein YaaA [Magnetococcales bacterium]